MILKEFNVLEDYSLNTGFTLYPPRPRNPFYWDSFLGSNKMHHKPLSVW